MTGGPNIVRQLCPNTTVTTIAGKVVSVQVIGGYVRSGTGADDREELTGRDGGAIKDNIHILMRSIGMAKWFN